MALLPGPYDAIQGEQRNRLRQLLRKSPLAALELHHPSILRRVELLWGTPEMETFLLRLATDAEFAGVTLDSTELDEIATLTQVHRLRSTLFASETTPRR